MVRALSFLTGNQDWIKAANPTDEEVLKQVLLADARNSMWTSEMNDADVWDDYNIKNYSKYLPTVDFVEVHLNTADE